MISSFFNKTKPINYVVLSTFLVLFFGVYRIFAPIHDLESANYLLDILAILALLMELFMINEIVKLEKVTDFSSYAMLFFVVLTVTFPESTANNAVIFSNFFVLLALWRLLAVKAMSKIKHKIFDASFFIGVASLFVDWALIYLILVFLVINLYDRNAFKNWIIPFIAILTLGILLTTTLYLMGELSFYTKHFRFSLDFIESGIALDKMIKRLLFAVPLFFITTFVFVRLRQKGGGKLLALRILFFAFLLSIVVLFLNVKGMEIAILAFFPAAVFVTNFLETIKQSRYKEWTLTLLILMPFLVLVAQLVS